MQGPVDVGRVVRAATDGRWKLGKEFYLQPAMVAVSGFLGKILVRQTPAGRLSGVINDVEAYPAFADAVHHGNKRTARTAVMWEAGGRAYVYLIYGVWHQFAAVVNGQDVPDVVFLRGVVPVEGIEVMAARWPRPMAPGLLANSPGKLCKSFAITSEQYGADLCGDELFLEDWGIVVPPHRVRTGRRIGINAKREGHDAPLRHFVPPREMASALEAEAAADQHHHAMRQMRLDPGNGSFGPVTLPVPRSIELTV